MDHDDIPLREALRLHYVENGFPPDGGLGEEWALVRVGPMPIGLPNTASRRRATPIHDLNHLVSGYGHDAMGEALNAAWELGGGCRDYAAAWVLNCGALGLGILRSPKSLLAAFVRGRRSGNLYGVDVPAVMDLPLSTVRSQLGLDVSHHEATVFDLVLFTATVALAPIVGAIPFTVSVVTSPVWMAKGIHRQRRVSPTPGHGPADTGH
jgi:hypothetical protein